MSNLQLQIFGHLMRRADSLEKTLMLGKIEGGRRKGLGHSGHTMIWVSNEVAKKYSPNTTGNVYEAGYNSYSFPGIDQYSNGYIKGGFKVYRFVGTPNPGIDASKYLKR